MTPTPEPEQIEAARKWVLENIDNAYGFEGTAEHVWLSDWLAEYAAHCTAEKDATIARLREVLSFDCTAFPEMEYAAIKWACHIAGLKGQPPNIPDAIAILEMCEDVARAALQETKL